MEEELDLLSLRNLLPWHSYKKLAKRTGVPISTIRNMFHGRKVMKQKVLNEAYSIIKGYHRLIERENRKIESLNQKSKELCI